MVDLLKESHIRLFSSKKMEQENKRGELLSFIDRYRLMREGDLVFYIRMREIQSTCQKLELSGKIRVLLRELPLACEERHRLITYAKSIFTSVDKSASNKFRCVDCGRRNPVVVVPDKTQMKYRILEKNFNVLTLCKTVKVTLYLSNTFICKLTSWIK